MEKFYFPRRSIIWIMFFTCTFVNYMLRVNMSILIMAMVKHEKNVTTKSIPVCTLEKKESNFLGFTSEDPKPMSEYDFGERFVWSHEIQGHILAALFWGIILTSIPGGILSEKFGGKMIIRIASIGTAVFTLLTPVVAAWSSIALIIVRFLMGLLCGLIYPACHVLISRWVPPNEKCIFISSLMGASFGIAVTWPILGVFLNHWGWKWSFYCGGIVGVLWCICWEIFMTNSPATHRMLTQREKDYIIGSLEGVSLTDKNPPYKKIFTSLPFWAYVISHFGNLYCLFFLMISAPLYMSTVLGYSLQNTGVMVSLPYLFRIIIGISFGLVGDYLTKKDLVNKTKIRKIFTVFSHIVPGICLIGQCITGCDSNWVIVLNCITIGISGTSTLTNFQNNQDLSPNYAGTLFGLANSISCCGGFISPIIVGWIIKNNNGLAEWRIIFGLTSTVTILSALFFIIFGSGEIQPWNENEDTERPP